MKQWLHAQPEHTRPHLVILQETMWKSSSEWTDEHYTCIHTGSGKPKEGGILIMISKSLCPSDRIRYNEIQLGRILHVKIPTEPSIELLAVYQHAWRGEASSAAKEPDVATIMLQQSPQQGQAFKELVQYRLQAVQDVDRINDILLSSWQIVFGSQPRTVHKHKGVCLAALWHHRKMASTAHTVFARWRRAVQYRSIRKKLHAQAVVAKRARLQQQLQDAESAGSSQNPGMLYQVLRRIAPKIRRRRMQLRDDEHKLAGPDKEAALVIKHFADVFAAQQAIEGFTLREAFSFTAKEFTQCLHELPVHKALPAHCAPAPLWKWCCEEAGPPWTRLIVQCFICGRLSIGRGHIRSSLEWAGIPGAVADVILGMRHAMTLQYSASGHSARTATGKGVRYGITCTGFDVQGMQKYRALFMRHLRAICESPVHLTRESNEALLVRAGVDCPLYTLVSQTAERHRITATQEVFKVQPPAITELWNQVLASIRPTAQGQDSCPTPQENGTAHAEPAQVIASDSHPLPATASMLEATTAPVAPPIVLEIPQVLPVVEETPAVAMSPERLTCTPLANTTHASDHMDTNEGAEQPSDPAPPPHPPSTDAQLGAPDPSTENTSALRTFVSKITHSQVCPKLHSVTQPAKAPVPQPALPFEADVNCEVFTDAFQGANKRSSPGPLEERPSDAGSLQRLPAFGGEEFDLGLAAAVGTMEIGVFEPPGAGTRGIIRTLVAASAEYANKKTKEPRMTLKDRLAKMEETPDLLAHVRWSQEREQLIPEEPQRMFPHAALSGHLDSILEILEEDKVLHQFNATRRFNDQTDSTVMFFIRVSLQGQKAQLLFQRLLALCGLGCLQMIDATLRRERLEPQPLAKQLRNLSDRRNRY
ncbi:unnamed protein product [Symbiodinium necroappetens]|uniref:Uncharacterized protein n=1 Tax=Symbiodinium necroappetens TaxID=1628268 RepID=A0A812U6E9_9DINO|nr:unnamed protein product [Symbiodinium necroappetens]